MNAQFGLEVHLRPCFTLYVIFIILQSDLLKQSFKPYAASYMKLSDFRVDHTNKRRLSRDAINWGLFRLINYLWSIFLILLYLQKRKTFNAMTSEKLSHKHASLSTRKLYVCFLLHLLVLEDVILSFCATSFSQCVYE